MILLQSRAVNELSLRDYMGTIEAGMSVGYVFDQSIPGWCQTVHSHLLLLPLPVACGAVAEVWCYQ